MRGIKDPETKEVINPFTGVKSTLTKGTCAKCGVVKWLVGDTGICGQPIQCEKDKRKRNKKARRKFEQMSRYARG